MPTGERNENRGVEAEVNFLEHEYACPVISFCERAPEMSKEKGDFSETSAENRPRQTSNVEVKFGPTVATPLGVLKFLV